MTEKILAKLQSRFNEFILSTDEFRNEMTIVIAKDHIVEVCQFLRDDDELRFDSLRDVCGTDQHKPGDRFEVVYNLFSLKTKFRLRLKVRVSEDDLHVRSVTGVWPTANFEEREAYDMFGIIFLNHPDLRRIYMMDNFEHYPLRKDYPLMGLPGAVELPKK